MSGEGQGWENIFPRDIFEALRRKSSRDPQSVFSKKLQVLIDFLQDKPELEKKVGLQWVSDTDFKMVKKNVAEVLGIKLNSLNVNLRDSKFTQLEHDKNGWTKWRKDGFTRNKDTSEKHMPTVGKLDVDKRKLFEEEVDMVWRIVSDGKPEISCSQFIEKSAAVFRAEEQEERNAKEVIRAIFNLKEDDMNDSEGGRYTRVHIQRFLAMFGPKNSAMYKIKHLLGTSNEEGNWLFFKQPDEQDFNDDPFVAQFDPNEPNKLVFRRGDKCIKRAWNLPCTTQDESYVLSDTDRTYKSWKDFYDCEIKGPVKAL